MGLWHDPIIQRDLEMLMALSSLINTPSSIAACKHHHTKFRSFSIPQTNLLRKEAGKSQHIFRIKQSNRKNI